jgi:hypothetical protein
MNNVVSLADFRCPIGSMAMHREYGVVDAINGWMRGIHFERREELSLAHESEDVVYAESRISEPYQAV